MELGKKLLAARLEAGLSQRQLAGDVVTRNMLSQIEHGTARPSMKTLQYFAARLGKPVSFFLDEEAVTSPNQQVMAASRQRFDAGDWAGAARALEDYTGPDETFDREQALIDVLCNLKMAEAAMLEGREPYARDLLEAAAQPTAYCYEALERRRLLLLGRIRGQRVSHLLPSLDEELLLRAQEAQEPERRAALLEAVEDQGNPRWKLLRGQSYASLGQYQQAAACLIMVEEVFPKEALPLLEVCFRELGDYKQAYEYACRQR